MSCKKTDQQHYREVTISEIQEHLKSKIEESKKLGLMIPDASIRNSICTEINLMTYLIGELELLKGKK